MEITNQTLVQSEPSPIWVASSAPKNSNRKDIREFLARSVDEGDNKTFMLIDTISNLRDNHNFFIEKTSEIRDTSGCYECVKVVPFTLLRKIYPMLITKKIS